MNLSDKEILELNELCNALVDGRLSSGQQLRLSRWLASSEEARQFYVRHVDLSASLCAYAGEMQSEAPQADAARSKVIHYLWFWLAPLAAAACVALVLWLKHQSGDRARIEPKPEEHVARLTGSSKCQWASGAVPIRSGDGLSKGQILDLAQGFAELTFDSGAQIVLEGPASLQLDSAWTATLRHGRLKANVPAEAMGFRISNPAVEVVDLGTEFSMVADGSGSADVLVLKGMIEASPRDSAEQRTIVLHENQSRHFARSGMSKVSDPEQTFALLNGPVTLDHFAAASAWHHWSFDEPDGAQIKADSLGLPLPAYDARVEEASEAILPALRVQGRSQLAFRFNGHLFARADFSGLSSASPHTVACWLKIPEDVHLPNAYAMFAWAVSSKKLGSHPVHIGWNRNPAEGTLGVLRTDYGGGFALGATPLRDGRWHHIAIVFSPDPDPDSNVDVRQYVDGRFEGEGKPSPPGTEISAKFSNPQASGVSDVLFLGCRIGADGPRKDRFRGEIDELWVADGALGPREIVELMKFNKPPQTEVASAKK
jgi:ferric-dicitrate binding protein FerR (iron transport regulator)